MDIFSGKIIDIDIMIFGMFLFIFLIIISFLLDEKKRIFIILSFCIVNLILAISKNIEINCYYILLSYYYILVIINLIYSIKLLNRKNRNNEIMKTREFIYFYLIVNLIITIFIVGILHLIFI